MGLFDGVIYNFRGLSFGMRTPRLLLLGLVRFAALVLLTALAVGFLLFYHQEIMNLLWARPESRWLLWLWYLLSWLLAGILMALAAVVCYLLTQILFSVVIMDYMSRITEQIVNGRVQEPARLSVWQQFRFLVRQEIPRTVVPVVLSLILMTLGWLTPLGPFLTVVVPAAAAVLIAWDNTDIVPARRRKPFKARLDYLLKNLPFHLGFGLPLLVPGLNLLLLSFAPVGATLYFLNKTRVSRPPEIVNRGT